MGPQPGVVTVVITIDLLEPPQLIAIRLGEFCGRASDETSSVLASPSTPRQ